MNDQDVILFTPKEAKAFLKVSIPTLNKLVARGKFNKYHITDCKRVFYKKHEIIDALEVVDPKEITRRKLLKIILKDNQRH